MAALVGPILPAKTIKCLVAFFAIGEGTTQNALFRFGGLTQYRFKVASFFPGLRHQRYHAPTAAHDMRQLLMGTDLAIRYIQKIGGTGNLTQRIPGLNVQGIIGAITGVGFIVKGDRAIGADREVVDDLLEIGAMVFAVALGKVQPGGRLARHAPKALYRGGIVV